MTRATRRQATLAAVLGLVCGSAQADCIPDASGTSFANPDDPACRNTMFTYTEAGNGGNDIALGYPVPLPRDSLTGVDGFRSYASLHAQHQDMMLVHETVSGNVVGQTAAGRDIWAYVVGDADTVTADGRMEPAVLLNGGIHAREWQSPEGVTEVFEQLTETATDGGFGQYLADNLTVVIVPVLNVDGVLTTQAFPDRASALAEQPREGRMRRKNLRHPSSGAAIDGNLATTADNFFGVDLNRNSVHGFGLNQGSLADVNSLIYRGPSAASEAEIQALLAAAALGPANRLRLYTDLHSFSQIFFAPMTGNARRDAITNGLAARMRAVTGNKYRWGPDPTGSGGIGTTADYFAYQYQVPSWTLETEPLNGGADYGGTGVSHSGFVMPDNQIARMRDELASMLLLGFYRQAGPPAVSALRIDRVDDGTVIYEARFQADTSGDNRQLVVGTDNALEAGVDYRFWLAFDKPMRIRTAGGAVTSYPGQSVEPTAQIVIALPDLGAGGTVVDVDGATLAWRNTPGGAPAGYMRYADDALTGQFALPATLDLAQAQTVVVQVLVRDLSLLALDGDPSTPADWGSGHWLGYENALGTDGDSGGADCSFRPWAAASAGVAPAERSSACPAGKPAPPAPPAPTPPTPPPQLRSGGGSAALLALMALLFVTARRLGKR